MLAIVAFIVGVTFVAAGPLIFVVSFIPKYGSSQERERKLQRSAALVGGGLFLLGIANLIWSFLQ